MQTSAIRGVLLGSILFVLVLVAGCSRKNRSIGADNVIAVFAEPKEYQQMEATLKKVFEREIETPALEPIFTLKPITLDDYENYRRWKSLIIVSCLDSDGQILPLIKSMLSPDNLEKVRQKQSFAFNKVEPWAYDQQLLVLVSTDIPTLNHKLESEADDVFGLMDAFLSRRIAREMYAKGEQETLEKKILDRFGWKVRIQHDYRVIFEDSGKAFVMLQRQAPARSFMVYWMPTDDPSIITPEWIIAKRNTLSLNFDEADSVDVAHTTAADIEFAGRRACKLTGLWYTRLHGGPFRSYTIYDENVGRIYMIDYAVYAPDREKEPILRQMDIMARTFQTRSDLK